MRSRLGTSHRPTFLRDTTANTDGRVLGEGDSLLGHRRLPDCAGHTTLSPSPVCDDASPAKSGATGAKPAHLQMVLPPDTFAAVTQLVRRAVGDDWAELARRIPGLGV